MNKIVAELLKLRFPAIANTDSLLEVVMATPNPEIAVELLCGLYDAPSVGDHIKVLHESRGVCTFKSYNKWDGNITYEHNEPVTKQAYFPEGTKKEDVNMENFDKLKCSSSLSNKTVYLYIPTGETRVVTNTMSYESWMRLPLSV